MSVNVIGEQKAKQLWLLPGLQTMASLPLFDSVQCESGRDAVPPAPRLVGIARLAAESEHIRDGHNIEYFTLPVRSILNHCAAPRMPFTWTINPYRGCEFACKYCYARYTHEYLELGDLDFEQQIYVKQQAAWLLRQELKQVKPGEEIAIGTATDPYQPAERQYEVTKSILHVLAEHEGLELGIVTKSNLILRDLELLQRIARRNRLSVSLTLTTTSTQLARILEPRAPRPDLRLDAVRKLVKSGIRTGVMVAPVIPGITDSVQGLDALVRATAEARGRYIFANPLFLKPCSASIFLPFLEKEFPQLAEAYRQRYADRAFVSPAYRKRISSLMASLRRKYGFISRKDRPRHDEAIREKQGGCEPRMPAEQLKPPTLFERQLRMF